MTSPDDGRNILRAVTVDLERYLSNLTKDDWNRPSACDKWAIADVVAHLIQQNQAYPQWIIDALKPSSSEVRSLPPRYEGKVDPEPIAKRAIAIRKDYGKELLSMFVKGNKDFDEALSQVGPDDWERLVYRQSGAESIKNIMDVFITERVVHGWDIISPVDPETRLRLESLPIIVERFARRPRWWEIESPPDNLTSPIIYQFQISDIDVQSTDFVVDGKEHQYMEASNDATPDVIFRCDAETFVLLAFGRITPESAISTGKLSYEGLPETANVFIQSFIGG
ncbi:MAG: maleylpyruvate isomerase family mycothiol-dependent enzyme [Chloroflexi bacterium]|nr:maleylpyruvate isomerase family mycothiol-dependent enzyme [Chloroflexota bacterium]